MAGKYFLQFYNLFQDHVDQTLFLPLGESQWQELAPLNEVWNKHYKYNFKFLKVFSFLRSAWDTR